MTLLEFFKENTPRGKGDEMMWQTVGIISEELAPMEKSHPEMYWRLLKRLHGAMSGGHYNENFARWQVDRMYYLDHGKKRHAPVTMEQSCDVYDQIRSRLQYDYNAFDFYVTWCMIYTDCIMLYKKWWPDATDEQMNDRVTEAAINYLNDDDCQESKIWKRFNNHSQSQP